MITIQQISEACNLSRVTVTRALRDETVVAPSTRSRVKKIAKQLGYIPNAAAQQLRAGKTRTVAIIANTCTTAYLGGVIEGIQHHLGKQDYDSISYEFRDIEDQEQLADKILSRRVAAVFMLQWSYSGAPNFFNKLFKFNVPVICIDREAGVSGIPLVCPCERDGAKTAVNYLVGKGHKRIGHITGPSNFSSSQERLMGYYQAMADNKLLVNSKWVMHGDYRYDGAKKAAKDFLSVNKDCLPSAVFAASDVIAACLIQQCAMEKIRVPDDLSVVGFCDQNFAKMLTPALTTLKQDPVKTAEKAVEVMMNIINSAKRDENNWLKGQKKVIPVTLVERDSVRSLIE